MDIDSIPELTEISDYYKNMKFKTRRIGGYDSEDVITHFEEVNTMYEAIYSRMQQENQGQSERIESLEAELSKMKTFYRNRCFELETQLESCQESSKKRRWRIF